MSRLSTVRIDGIIDEWLHIPTLKLRAGEMTAQETRTVVAVLTAIRTEAAALSDKHETFRKVADIAFIQKSEDVIDLHRQLKSELEAKEALIDDLRVKLSAARMDQARYQWLRYGNNDELVIQHGPVAKDYHWLPRNERLDAAIDAAMYAPRYDGHDNCLFFYKEPEEK